MTWPGWDPAEAGLPEMREEKQSWPAGDPSSVERCLTCGVVRRSHQGKNHKWVPGGDDPVHNPAHYGGGDNLYEAIKVIEAWGLGFHLGNTVKYIVRAGRKDDELEDLRKAAWYLQRRIEQLEAGPK